MIVYIVLVYYCCSRICESDMLPTFAYRFSQGESFAAIEVKLSEQWNLNFLKYVQETTGEEADMMTGDDEM